MHPGGGRSGIWTRQPDTRAYALDPIEMYAHFPVLIAGTYTVHMRKPNVPRDPVHNSGLWDSQLALCRPYMPWVTKIAPVRPPPPLSVWMMFLLTPQVPGSAKHTLSSQETEGKCRQAQGQRLSCVVLHKCLTLSEPSIPKGDPGKPWMWKKGMRGKAPETSTETVIHSLIQWTYILCSCILCPAVHQARSGHWGSRNI